MTSHGEIAADLAACNGGPVPEELKVAYLELAPVGKAYVAHHLGDEHPGVLAELVAVQRDKYDADRAAERAALDDAADPETTAKVRVRASAPASRSGPRLMIRWPWPGRSPTDIAPRRVCR